MRAQVITILSLATLLAACTSTAPQQTPINTGKEIKHKIPTPYVAPENPERWQNLGVSPNGNILNELDKKSIQRSGDIVSFSDKKTIFDVSKEAALSSIPNFKYSINSWQINCKQNTFQLKSMEFYDANDHLISRKQYSDRDVIPMQIVPNSASFQQKNVVCAKKYK